MAECRAGEWDRAQEVFERLEAECDMDPELEPNVFTYNTMISAAGQASDSEEAIFYYEQMLEAEIMPDKVRSPRPLAACSPRPLAVCSPRPLAVCGAL